MPTSRYLDVNNLAFPLISTDISLSWLTPWRLYTAYEALWCRERPRGGRDKTHAIYIYGQFSGVEVDVR